MSSETEAALRNWGDEEIDVEDAVFKHFLEGRGRWLSNDVAEEGLRVWNLMFADDPAEPGSPIDSVIAGVALAAESSAYRAIAAALGLDAERLELAVALWAENQQDQPAAVSLERLMEIAAEQLRAEVDQ